MKIVSILMIALVGTLILNLPMQSYADPQLDTLLRIASQARDNLSINLSQLTTIPSEISNLYKKGSDETDALNIAVQQQDVGSAKQHFLSAMQFFKATNDKINSLNATSLNDQQRTQILTLQDQINSIQTTGQRLKDVATTNNVDANFTEFDQMIQQAKQDLSNNNVDATATDIQNLNQAVSDIHHYIATIAQQRTSDRAKDFTEKQIERLSTENTNMSSNTTQESVNTVINANTTSRNATATIEESPQEMVAKLRTLISQGKIDEAIQELKTLQEHQKKRLENNSSESTLQQDNNSVSDQNPNPLAIPNNENNSTISENETNHDRHPIPSSIPNNENNSTISENETNHVQGKTGQNTVNSPKDNSQNTKNNHGKNDGGKRNNNKRDNRDYHED